MSECGVKWADHRPSPRRGRGKRSIFVVNYEGSLYDLGDDAIEAAASEGPSSSECEGVASGPVGPPARSGER